MTRSVGSPPPNSPKTRSKQPAARSRRTTIPLLIGLILILALVVTLLLVILNPEIGSLRRADDLPPAAADASPSSDPGALAQENPGSPPGEENPRDAGIVAADMQTDPPTATPLPLPTATQPPPTPTPTPEPAGVVNADVVNVRSGPGTDYAILGRVTLGEEVDILGRNPEGNWWRICCVTATSTGNEEVGWIIEEYVDENFSTDAIRAVPLADLPPTPEPAPENAAPIAAGASNGSVDQSAALLAAPATGLPGVGGFGPPGDTNPLTGLPLAPGRSAQRPVVVCINNDSAARPQYGLAQADVAYDYLMEGFSITRFSAVFYGDSTDRIGPVRSARLINYYLGALYDAGLLCSGASDRVRYLLKNDAPFPYLDIDLDDPSNSRYSASLGSDYRTRLQTSTSGFRAWLTNWATEKAPTLRGFTFGGVPGGGAPAGQINIPFPGVTGSDVAYGYDVGSGRYLRFLGGEAHVDGASGAQLGFENVVVQYVPHEVTDIVEDSLGSLSIRLNLFGSGRAILFRDGLAFEGTWASDSRGDMPRFYAADGSEIPLKPGKSWISVVPFNYTISYQ